MTITKDSLADSISGQTQLPKKSSQYLVETLVEIIKSTLASGEDVLISGFGKFTVKDKRQRRGRNPATGEDLMLDRRRIVNFSCSAVLKDRLNGKKGRES